MADKLSTQILVDREALNKALSSTKSYIDKETDRAKAVEANKVDKVNGKGLSTNDYTTTEKNKLAGIADGANKYTYPYTHYSKDSVGDIGWDASKNQLITGSAIAFWNGRYDKTGSNLQYCRRGEIAALSDIKTYTLPTASATVLGGVKIGNRLSITTDGVLSGNAPQWSDVQGKPSLSTVATSGSYNDLTNKPTIPSVGNGTIIITQAGQNKGSFTLNQGGNATIALNDTDTTYSAATSEKDGLLSAEDKKNLDYAHKKAQTLGSATLLEGISDPTYKSDSVTFAEEYSYAFTDHFYALVPHEIEIKSATTTQAGVLSAADKKKLDGIQEGAEKNIVYSVMTGAHGTTKGVGGLVPTPTDPTKFLRGDATWATPVDTTYSVATTTTDGLMSAADKTKLDKFGEASTYLTTSGGELQLGSTLSVQKSGTLSGSLVTIGDSIAEMANGLLRVRWAGLTPIGSTHKEYIQIGYDTITYQKVNSGTSTNIYGSLTTEDLNVLKGVATQLRAGKKIQYQ